ncbi:hypothetical protein [Sphingopyxis panaciterrulae]|nr:hypothetical protein [Sphingopyxis panaciterrulae]
MTIDLFSAAAGKTAVGEIVKPTIGALRRQIAMRGSQYVDAATAVGVDAILDQAIAVLAGNAATLPEAILVRLKGISTDRPSSFADADARHFVGDNRVVTLLKAATFATFGNQDVADKQAEARDIHGALFGGDGFYGETLFDEAVRYCVFALLSHLTTGDKFVIEILNEKAGAIQEGVGAIQSALGPMADQLQQLVDRQQGKEIEVESEVLDLAVERDIRRLRRLRLALGDGLTSAAEQLGLRLEAGLRHASDGVKAAAFREIAIVLSRAKRPDDAEPFVEKAEALGADTTCERARLALARGNPEEAMALLRDRADPVSRSLLVDAVNHRDGETAALDFFDANYAGADLTGHALQATAFKLGKLDRLSDAEALLAAATAEQIEENPVILHARAHVRIATALPPDVAKRYVLVEGIIPQPGDLRDDADGEQALSAAQEDLRKLQAAISGIDAPDLAMLADINLLFLGMRVGSEEERKAGRDRFIERLADPAEAVRLAPLASLYKIEIDWPAVRKELERAEQLGGYDDAQLSAAFTLTLHGSSAQDILALIGKYRERLYQYQGKSVIVSMEVEAMARSGDIESAHALIDQNLDALDEDERSFLEATLIEAAGGDGLAARLSQFEKTGSTHDLQILVGSLRDAGDDRLGEYLMRLWHLRHQLDDARAACNALISAQKEEEAEAFLDELGNTARGDPYLRTHLAWARQRQGRLSEAKTELDALIASGVDDRNIRQLRIILAVETGRWSDLISFVQHELAMKENRSAAQLMEAARIAQAVDSSEAMPLARAAIAMDPDDAHLNIAGYSVAVAAGQERSAEVSGWLAKARTGSGTAGPLFEKDLDDFIAMAKESRARSDHLNKLVSRAELPFFIAMQPLGTTQSALILSQFAGNAELTDSRRKVLFPLFAGNRGPVGDFNPNSVAFDPLSLLILEYLGFLPRALAAFDDVMLPAGTMHSFFEDRVKSGPPQPSRIVQARAIKDRIASGLLMIRDLESDAELVSDAGEEFAELYRGAEEADGYLVAVAPIHRPGNFRETLDPARFRERLFSPAGLVKSLLDRGVLSEAQAEAAQPFVEGAGPWDDEPQPEARRALFVSNLAVQYLSDAGLLPILQSYSGALVIRRDVVEFADREIAAATEATTISSGIERVRQAIADALALGRIRIGPWRIRPDEKGQGADRINSPVMSVLRDSGGVDAFVCDDRAMNKYLQFDDPKRGPTPFLTTPDLLILLHRRGVITAKELAVAREKLRGAGAGLMQPDAEELFLAARGSNWSIGPNAELRNIRDAIHLPIARGLLQLPQERIWVKSVSMQIGMTIRRIWQDFDDPEDAARAASYLLDMIPDVGALAAGDDSVDRDLWVQDVSRHTLWAIASIFDLSADKLQAYRQWFTTHVAPGAGRRDPGAIEAVARTLFNFLDNLPRDESEHDEN